MKYDLKSIRKKSVSRALHLRRKAKVRKIISGTNECPRLSVFRSAKHIYVQAIDDVGSNTLAGAGCLESAVKDKVKGLKKIEAAKAVGEMLGKKLKAANVSRAVFDRNGFRYTGRVAALAEGIRNSGIEI